MASGTDNQQQRPMSWGKVNGVSKAQQQQQQAQLKKRRRGVNETVSNARKPKANEPSTTFPSLATTVTTVTDPSPSCWNQPGWENMLYANVYATQSAG